MYSGNDIEFGDFVRAGCTGGVSGVSSVFPKPFVALADALRHGDEQAAAAAQDRVKRAVEAVAGADIALIKAGSGSARSARRAAARRARPAVARPARHPPRRHRGAHVTTPLPIERTAIVTGAGSPRGIGRATCDRLARDGWAVAVLDVDGDAAKRAAADLADAHSVPTLGIAVDIGDEDAVDAAVDAVESALPPIVGLANVAGVSSPVDFLDVTTAEWDRVFDVNMRGTFFVTRRVVPAMIAVGVGRIVSVSSISAQRGGGTYSKVPYSASKAAVIGFTRALAREMGPHHITVNCVAPGPIDTEIMGGTLTDERKAAMSADIPLGRVGTVHDVAALLTFLMSEDAGYITAATYDVNGGLQIS